MTVLSEDVSSVASRINYIAEDERLVTICGDCREVFPLLQDDSIEAVITDPPYAREYQDLYEIIARYSREKLVRGGSLMAILPHYAIPEILPRVGKHLKWRWMDAMWQESGNHPRMAMGIEIMWKPIGWWVKGAWPSGRGFVRDGFSNEQPSNKIHKWEQSLDWALHCLKKVPKGRPVLDPLMGSGTVGVACAMTGRKFTGIEMDLESYEKAINRIKDTLLRETSIDLE
jgi:site-specific DNA-methyltransferase (adenine-specific)